MLKSTRRLTAYITGISGAIAVVIALGLPFGYWAMVYRAQDIELRTEVEINAAQVTALINASPETWRLQLLRLHSLISESHTHSELTEHRALYDAAGVLITGTEAAIGRMRISRRATVYDSGVAVGALEVTRDLAPVVRGTLLVALFGLVLGAGVFVTLRLLPLRALDRAIDNLKAQKEKAEVTLAAIGDAVITADAQGRVAYVNDAAAQITGWSAGEARGMKLEEVMPLITEDGTRVPAGEGCPASAVVVGRDGARHPVEYTFSPIRDGNGQPAGGVAVLRDISERQRAEAQMAYLAHYDGLTGLANRNLFHDRLEGALSRAQRSGQPMALFHLDLDRFKHVNESLGHVAGDRILKLVAERLRLVLRNTDSLFLIEAPASGPDDGGLTLSRLGGDEFGIVAEGLQHAEDASVVGGRLVAAFADAFEADGQELFVTPSVGIAICPDDAWTAGELVRHAESARYRSKALGGNNFQFYTQDMNDKVQDRLRLESSLRHALEEEQWELFYQPKIAFDSGAPIGAEALLRWRHPERGLVSPAEFIPVLEETGLIVAVGEWVLRTACRQLATWQGQGLPLRNIAVNLSARQFMQKDLRAQVADALAETGLAAESLELELTESMLIHDVEASIAIMKSLKAMKVRLSIDDFGTGYSSLAYLKRFDIDTLKIDQSFVRDITNSYDDAAIATAVVAIARSLRLNTVAEGVETEGQLAFLRAAGCVEAQGFLFSRPLPAAAFERWLASYQAVGAGRETV